VRGSKLKLSHFDDVELKVWQISDLFHVRRRAPALHDLNKKVLENWHLFFAWSLVSYFGRLLHKFPV
jgi:hypothetical protein